MSSSFRYRINPFSVLRPLCIQRHSIDSENFRSFRPPGPLRRPPSSQMIQAATDSIWSHVAFVVRLEVIDRIMVLESLEPVGVRTVPLSKYLSRVRLGVLPDPRYRYPARPARLRYPS